MLAVSSISLHPPNDSKHYVLARSTEIKTNLDGPSPRVAISFRAGPRIWACAWPPTEKAPLELVLYCWHCRGSHVHDILENLQPEKKRT